LRSLLVGLFSRTNFIIVPFFDVSVMFSAFVNFFWGSLTPDHPPSYSLEASGPSRPPREISGNSSPEVFMGNSLEARPRWVFIRCVFLK